MVSDRSFLILVTFQSCPCKMASRVPSLQILSMNQCSREETCHEIDLFIQGHTQPVSIPVIIAQTESSLASSNPGKRRYADFLLSLYQSPQHPFFTCDNKMNSLVGDLKSNLYLTTVQQLCYFIEENVPNADSQVIVLTVRRLKGIRKSQQEENNLP